MAKKKSNKLTSQGIRNLNDGHTFYQPEYPDNCTLGLHHWGQWMNGWPMADYRVCEDCMDMEFDTKVS
jgi:hypothetical protein